MTEAWQKPTKSKTFREEVEMPFLTHPTEITAFVEDEITCFFETP